MKSEVSYKVDLLKAMDNYVRNVWGDDEETTEIWFSRGVPDGADYDDFEEIATDRLLFNHTLNIFGHYFTLEP